MEYNSTFVNGTELPDWIEFYPDYMTDNWYTLYSEDENLLNKSLEIIINTTIWDYYYATPTLEYEYTFSWWLDFSWFVFIPTNSPPRFNKTLENFEIFLGQELDFDTGPPSDDTVSVDIEIDPK